MNYGEFLKILKPFCINKSTRNEDLVNEPLKPIIRLGHIKKSKGPSKGDPLYYDTTESSRIINNKLDVSSRIRNALRYEGIEDAIEETMYGFYEDYIDKNLLGDMIDSFLSSIEEDNTFLPKEINAIKACSNDPAQFLTKIMIHSLRESNRCSYDNSSYVWKRGDNYIRIVKGNIFNYALGRRMKKERIVVIPVNTSFDVHVSTQLEAETFPLVSKNTIHGEFLSRLYKGTLTEDILRDRIQQNLMLNGMSFDDNKTPLPIGTIATLAMDETTVYLLAISSFDDNNNAQSSASDIQTAVDKLVQYYNQKGQGYDLYLPLLGTGMSRANLSHQDSIDLIIKTLLDSKNSLQGKYNIVVLPENLKEITIRTEDEYSEN